MPRTPKPAEKLGYDSLPFSLPRTRERIAFDANAVATKFPDMGRASSSGAAPVTQRFGRATAAPSAFVRDTSGETTRIAADAALAKIQRRSPNAAPIAQDAAPGRSEVERLFPDMNRLA